MPLTQEEDSRIDSINSHMRHGADARRDVEHKAAAHRSTRDALTVAIRNARELGLSLREIAEAAGMSHESVRRIAS